MRDSFESQHSRAVDEILSGDKGVLKHCDDHDHITVQKYDTEICISRAHKAGKKAIESGQIKVSKDDLFRELDMRIHDAAETCTACARQHYS